MRWQKPYWRSHAVLAGNGLAVHEQTQSSDPRLLIFLAVALQRVRQIADRIVQRSDGWTVTRSAQAMTLAA